jgi:uncharacterized membrane-anchored protein YhcB (DUF1043 family)
MIPTLPWLWLLGAGVALVVGLIAFMVAAGLTDRQVREAACTNSEHADRGSNRIRRAS